MNSSLAKSEKFDVQKLAQAMAQNTGAEALNFGLTPAQWEVLAGYLQPFAASTGQVLITQGDEDRALYLLQSGGLSVHYQDEKSRIRMAMVVPGSVAGEAGFFSHRPRNATVHATGPSVLWRLTSVRFGELSNRQPAIALQIVMALGAVLARRMRDGPRRIAAT